MAILRGFPPALLVFNYAKIEPIIQKKVPYADPFTGFIQYTDHKYKSLNITCEIIEENDK